MRILFDTALSRVRALVKQADPKVVEEWKWRKPKSAGTPVWSRDLLICSGETCENVVRVTLPGAPR